ncbi:MAG: class I SAM-dependent methyltransferase [Gammaproteobacteria bacterium]|nr:class I SAM-dependent methyltransferase [Gammaproteobacteria bacterium]
MSERLGAEEWATYWQKGTITTFHGRFAGNYDGAVREYWQGLFSALPAGAAILDLATGNGALALLAQQHSAREGLGHKVTGIDYADIDPPKQFSGKAFARHLRAIDFRGRARLEDTGLDTASFDLAISQFGFEYGEPEAAAREVARVLKPKVSTFAAMLHHAESAIIRQAKDGLAQIAACVKSGLSGAVRDLHKHLDRLATRGEDPAQDSRAIDLRANINRILAELQQEGGRYADPNQLVFYVENSMSTFNPQVTAGKPLADKLAMLQHVTAETDAYRQRMRDLISSALTDPDIEAMKRRIQSHGFTTEEDRPFVFEGTHFCHLLRFSR